MNGAVRSDYRLGRGSGVADWNGARGAAPDWSNRTSPNAMPQPLYDDAFTFLALSVALFTWILGPLTPVLTFMLLIMSMVLRPRFSAGAILTNWKIMLLPGFGLASALWSINPSLSAYYGVQYIVTAIVGILIGASMSREQALRGVFYAFAIFSVSSAVFGRSVGWGDGGPGGTAFAGLVASKNSAGDIAALGAMASLTYFFRYLLRSEFLGALVAAGLLMVQVYLTFASQSSGAVLGLAIGTGFIVFASMACAVPQQYRVLLSLMLFAGIVVLVGTSNLWFRSLLEAITAAAGKNPTLTGRTEIWEDASRLMRERPAFGLGFSAFWVHGNLDAEGIWRNMGILNRTGFNFHNSGLEILVHLGWVGLSLFVGIFTLQAVRLFAKTVHQPDLPLIFWSAFFIYQISRVYAESRGLKLFDYGTIMLFAGMAAGSKTMVSQVPIWAKQIRLDIDRMSRHR